MTNEHSGLSAPSPAALLAGGGAMGTWDLDPESSTVAFSVKHFWGLITVRGHFSRFTGRATVGPSGDISVVLTLDADSLDTKNKQRDKHLRSADFFDVANHPTVTFTTTDVSLDGDAQLRVAGELTAAGHPEPIDVEARIAAATSESVTVDVEADVDRTRFDMTWSPMRMTAPIARLQLHLHWSKVA